MPNIPQDIASYFFASQEDKDAAQRISDAVALHFTAAGHDFYDNVVNRWAVFRLSDGRSPDGNTLYGSKDEAVHFQKGRSKDMCYLKLVDAISPKDAWHFLRVNRHPMVDTTAPEHVINPQLMPHMSNLTRRQRRAIGEHHRRYSRGR